MSAADLALSRAAADAARRALEEDLAGYGDLTGRVLAGEGVAWILSRKPGVLSGTEALLATARLVDPAVGVELRCHDGDTFAAGARLARVHGPFAGMLAMERTALNFLGRLSGVATTTAAYVAETAGTRARIAATRKTTPGLRALEKAAVEHGGGLPHRYGLFDSAMIKDNHIAAAGGLTAAVKLVRDRLGHAHLIEVETTSLAQVEEALACGITVIMLDNTDAAHVREAVALVAGRAVIEVSGGVTLEKVRALAEAGADVISCGAIVTAAAWVDIAMDAEA